MSRAAVHDKAFVAMQPAMPCNTSARNKKILKLF